MITLVRIDASRQYRNMPYPYHQFWLLFIGFLLYATGSQAQPDTTANLLIERYLPYGGSTTRFITEDFVVKHGTTDPYGMIDSSEISVLNVERSTKTAINRITCDSSIQILPSPRFRYGDAFTFTVLRSRPVRSHTYLTVTEFQVSLETKENQESWTEYLMDNRLTIHVVTLTRKGERLAEAFKAVFAEAPPELETAGYVISYTVDNVENPIPIAETYRLDFTPTRFADYVEPLLKCTDGAGAED